MMCLIWQFFLVHLTLILSQLKIGRLHEHDDISKNVSNFSFQNFIWASRVDVSYLFALPFESVEFSPC